MFIECAIKKFNRPTVFCIYKIKKKMYSLSSFFSSVENLISYLSFLNGILRMKIVLVKLWNLIVIVNTILT